MLRTGTLLLVLPALTLAAVAGAAEPPSPAPGGCPAEDPRCREVTLVAPDDSRLVSVEREGVEMTFGLKAFQEAASARRDKDLVELLQARTEAAIRLQPEDLKTTWLQQAALFAAARLLEEGRARVRVVKTGRPATRVLVQRWDWVGCSGGCRQAGREFRLGIPGEPFLRLTDLFEDGEPGTF
jgi:hypothetical protein